MTFKEQVRDKLINSAKQYLKLLDVDFVLQSDSFKYRKEYLLRFHKDNFLHLTGVTTNLKAADFFEKCLNETITTDDYVCDSSSELKGKIKEKLKNMLNIDTFFDGNIVCQEMFEKNRVKCKIASSNGSCTLGFISINKFVHVPLTLLNKNRITAENQITNVIVIKNTKQGNK